MSLAEVAETPRAVAESIERRTWSSLWQLDAEQWRDRVEPAVARLRALPDQDRPRPRRMTVELAVFSR